MAGMRKAARRRLTGYQLPDHFFDSGEVLVSAIFVMEDGTPNLAFGMIDKFVERSSWLEIAESFEFLLGEGVFALDVVLAGEGPRRMLTEVEPSELQQLVELIGHSTHLSLTLMDCLEEREACAVRRRCRVRHARNEDLLQEPFEIGEGDFMATTINRWNGAVYVHRFATPEEATEQTLLNIEVDAPFGGVIVN